MVGCSESLQECLQEERKVWPESSNSRNSLYPAGRRALRVSEALYQVRRAGALAEEQTAGVQSLGAKAAAEALLQVGREPGRNAVSCSWCPPRKSSDVGTRSTSLAQSRIEKGMEGQAYRSTIRNGETSDGENCWRPYLKILLNRK